MTYTVELKCPHCGQQSQIVCVDQEVPHVNCGNCLANKLEIVELTIIRVEVT
jgi:hypothetical protein